MRGGEGERDRFGGGTFTFFLMVMVHLPPGHSAHHLAPPTPESTCTCVCTEGGNERSAWASAPDVWAGQDVTHP